MCLASKHLSLELRQTNLECRVGRANDNDERTEKAWKARPKECRSCRGGLNQTDMAASSEVVVQVQFKTYNAPISIGDPFGHPRTNAVAETKA